MLRRLLIRAVASHLARHCERSCCLASAASAFWPAASASWLQFLRQAVAVALAAAPDLPGHQGIWPAATAFSVLFQLLPSFEHPAATLGGAGSAQEPRGGRILTCAWPILSPRCVGVIVIWLDRQPSVERLRGGLMRNRLLVRWRWAIETEWHWVRDVPLGQDAHRDSEHNGVQALPRLHPLAFNRLRSNGFRSIRSGLDGRCPRHHAAARLELDPVAGAGLIRLSSNPGAPAWRGRVWSLFVSITTKTPARLVQLRETGGFVPFTPPGG